MVHLLAILSSTSVHIPILALLAGTAAVHVSSIAASQFGTIPVARDALGLI